MALIKDIQEKLKKRRGPLKLDETSVIYLEGKMVNSRTEIKEAVKKLGCTYTIKLSKKVTHIIVGDHAENQEILNKKFKLLTEKEFYQLEAEAFPKFITEEVKDGNTDSEDNITELLNSAEVTNVKIGLQILESGGVTDQILEILLVMAKTHEDAKVRDKAKKLVILYGPPEWKGIAESKVLFKTINTTAKEKDVHGKLLKMANEKGVDAAATFALFLYKKYKKGLRLVVMNNLISAEWKRKAYDLLIEEGHFNFASAVGFKNWKNEDPSKIYLFPYKEKNTIPIDVLEHFKVTSISLHNIKLAAIPRELSKFTDLKEIDLSFNFIKSFPPYFERLKEVEVLDLTWNMFEEFPMRLLKFPNLKKIDLRYCGRIYEYKPLEISDEIKSALPNCEIIV